LSFFEGKSFTKVSQGKDWTVAVQWYGGLNLLPHRISRTLWRYFPGIWTKVIIQFPINMRHKKCCKYFTCFAIACMPLKLSNACWSARSVRFRLQKDANLYLGLPTLRKTQVDTY
jgi:hypothetical protein